MYVPRHFAAPGDEAVRAVLESTDFAPVLSVRGGRLEASHLPLHYRPEAGRYGAFDAHLARANPQWRDFEAGCEALVICRGPHGYVSPAWYAERSVPTWDYVAVHAWCRPRLVRERGELGRLVGALMRRHERRTGTGARYEDYAPEYLARMLGAIVGVELAIERVEASFKLSQNRSAADRESVCARLRASGDPSRDALADLIERCAPTG